MPRPKMPKQRRRHEPVGCVVMIAIGVAATALLAGASPRGCSSKRDPKPPHISVGDRVRHRTEDYTGVVQGFMYRGQWIARVRLDEWVWAESRESGKYYKKRSDIAYPSLLERVQDNAEQEDTDDE